jgi:hypothetical protein
VRAAVAFQWSLLALALAVPAEGQTARTLIVRVTDSAATPIAGADLAVMRGVQTVVAQSTTDASGRHAFSISGEDDASLEVVARKIGFARGDRFFTLGRDTTVISIVLHHTVQSLDAVHISAEQNLRRKSYFLDADAIANSDRPLFDGLDVFTKLRPDMLYSRSAGAFEHCEIEEVWVNGRRLPISPYDSLDPMIETRRKTMHKPPKSKPVSLAVLKTLSLVKPEHIAEINYRDCMDKSIGRMGDQNAAFITLKPGVAFDLSRGTYVAGQQPSRPAFRSRLLGLYDESNGEPLAGAVVVNTTNGDRVQTTSTGTVSLAFLPAGKTMIKISKPGYRDFSFEISISPADTIPLTLVLERIK